MLYPYRKKKLAAMAFLASAACVPLASQAGEGFYVGGQAGINKVPAENLLDDSNIVSNNKTHTGFMAGLQAGYSYDNGLRPELEFGYRNNEAATLTSNLLGGSATSFDASGHVGAFTTMGNLWYDFKQPTGLFKDLHPYIGGGIGLAHVSLQEGASALGGSLASDSQNAFAYQAGAGLAYDIRRNITATFDYRYLQSNRTGFEESDLVSKVTGDSDGSYRYRAQSIGLGLRISFEQPPAPVAAPVPEPVAAVPLPPPSPPPAPALKCPNTPPGFKVDADGCIIQQTIVLHAVNFKTNSDQLTDADKAAIDPVISTLQQALQSQSLLHVEVDGHTDSRGSAAYNLRLSQMRANAVKNYLASKGVDATRLSAQGFGGARPVASNDTVDGRAQNRRVEFVILGTAAPDTKFVTEGSTTAEQQSAEDKASGNAPSKSKAK